jgi:hypothetical protein
MAERSVSASGMQELNEFLWGALPSNERSALNMPVSDVEAGPTGYPQTDHLVWMSLVAGYYAKFVLTRLPEQSGVKTAEQVRDHILSVGYGETGLDGSPLST